MKKFKHKKTGKIVEEKGKIFVTSFDINSGKAQEIIPAWILENTNDWEEIIEKPVLFTTEDGVDKNIGDEVWYVINDFSTIDKEIILSLDWDFENYKYFSTRKAAENYIKMNKPCLSLSEVLDIYDKKIGGFFREHRELLKRELTKIVKERM